MPEEKIIPVERSPYIYNRAFRYIRNTFFEAAQDSFTKPPTQNPDFFEVLQNFMPPVQGTLKRRWGYKTFGTLSFTNPATLIQSFQKDIDGSRRLVYSNRDVIAAFNEDGTSFNSSLFALNQAPASAQQPRMVVSRNYGFFADGNALDMNKWDGSASGGTSRWGIDINQQASTSTGPNSPATASDAGTSWTNPTNVFAADGLFATASPAVSSSVLRITNFGFAVPTSSTIVGILVEIKSFTNVNGGFYIAFLTKDGTTNYGGGRTSGTIPLSNAYIPIGNSTDQWNGVWTPADFNTATFGVLLQAVVSAGVPTFNVDHVRVTVYAKGGAITLGAPVAGAITINIGRKYVCAFKNSTSTHVSDLNPPSASSGPLTAQNQPLSGIPVSNDAQVDKKLILATADGGDLTNLFLVTELANATTTYTDSMPEATLLAQSVYLEINQIGQEIGLAFNSPPPFNGLLPTKHKGRIYLLAGQLLYFSKSIDELTTSTGTIAGRWEEAFPVDNFFDISSESAEQGRGLLSDGLVLYIGTERHIRRLLGSGPLDFQKPEVIFSEVGILNQDVWKIIFLEGTPVGAMWLTPDFRVIGSDFNTYQNVGTPVQDVLNTINTAIATTKCWATFFSQGEFNLYILGVPTGTNLFADTLLVFDLKARRWHVWKMADLMSFGFFNVNASGIPQLLWATSPVNKYIADSTAIQDRVGGTPVNITAQARTSWLNLGNPGLRKMLNEIEVTTGDSGTTVTIEGAGSATGADVFSAPDSVASNAALTLGPFNQLKAYLADSVTKHRYYRLTFTSTSSTVTDILDGFNIEAIPVHYI